MSFPGFPGNFPRRPRRPRGDGQQATMPRGLRITAIVVAALVVLGVLFVVLGNIYTDLLWYRSVGYSKVFTTEIRVKLELFFIFGLIMALIIGANIVIAYRLRPAYRPTSPEQQSLERLRIGIAPYRWVLITALLLLIGISAGVSATNRWRTWVLWRNAVPFHVKDAQFHRDISYFMFTYPFQRWVLGFAFTAIVLSIIAAGVTHYLYGALRIQTPGEKVTPAARAHLSSLLGVFVLLKAFAYFLDRYGLAFSERGVVTGPSYTDVHASLPAKTILVVVAVICAGLFFANIAYRRWTLPIVAFGVMVVSAIVIGGVYPALVQQFSVKPSEADKEAPYIGRNIEATRAAYALTPDTVKVTPYSAESAEPAKVLRTQAAALPGIRLVDPNLVAPTYEQLQQVRGYYTFPDVLDIDRYGLLGKQTDAVVAVRDINLAGLSGNQRSWINQHLVYTHGFGFVGARTTSVDQDGKPVFFERRIPPVGELGAFQPRVYFGENSPTYSIVGKPSADSPDRELDRPTNVNGTTSGQVNNTYEGSGGVALNSFFRRVLYAVKFKEKNILLSNRVGSYSRILYIRDPRARVRKVAPYLRLDGDPYPAVVGGHIVWIVDGYTTSSGYPYSERQSFGSATQDTLTQTTNAVSAQAANQINYIRNSVKATVDAYDGTVTLYAWDPSDPILQTWEKVFPGTVRDRSDIPPDLMAHLRYPEDMFKIQRELLTRYHVTDPRSFYSGQDFWQVPGDPTAGGVTPQPPYYISLQMPGQTAPTFSLTSTLVPRNRNNLAAVVSVDSDPGADYGTMRVLQLPRDTQVNGPQQIFNNFESFPRAASRLTLLRQQGSQVLLGNLLTLPVGGGLLYVEPVYVAANGASSYPLLKFVFASFGEQIAFQPTLDRALDVVFHATATGQQPPPSNNGGGPPSQGGGTLSPEVRQAAAAVQAAYDATQRDLRNGDLAAYARDYARLGAALRDLRAALAAAGAGSQPSGAPSPTASPATRASASPTASP